MFAGAGFSKALFDVPIQRELIDSFLSWDSENGDFRHLSPELHRLLSVTQDIELVLSHYHHLAYPREGPRNHRYAREFIFVRVALAQYLHEVLRNASTKTVSSSSSLLQGFLERRQLDMSNFFMVSTNYDLAIETLLDDIFGADSYYYPGVSTHPSGDRIPIFKLHGSINWMEDRGSVSQRAFYRSTQPVQLATPAAMRLRRLSADDGVSFERDATKYTPIIVPFIFQKNAWLKKDNPQWRRIFDRTWDVAERGMRSSTTLLFWGYGLPAADYRMFSLLHQVLEHSNARCEVVDNGNTTTNIIRLGQLFSSRTSICQDGLLKASAAYGARVLEHAAHYRVE